MYFKSARSHARSYMQSMRPRSEFETQMDSEYYDRMHMAFYNSAKAKKPGRVLQRISKTLDKDWMDLQILRWTRNSRAVMANIITYDASAEIEIQSDYDRKVFCDDLIQFNELVFSADRFRMGCNRGALVTMTLHAITRLLEREGCDPEDLPLVIPELMRVARSVVLHGFDETYPEATNSFMIPFAGGAFVAINCPIRSASGESIALTDGLSIRTWLSPEMVTPEIDERLHAMDEILEATYHNTKAWTTAQIRARLDHNSRPHDYRARQPQHAQQQFIPPLAQMPRRQSERTASSAIALPI